MALSWNEIKDRAVKFSKDWADAASEDAEAQSFLNAFFDVFGISRKRVGAFEHKVKKLNDTDGYIDLLWKGVILIEMKSAGKDLDKAVDLAYRPYPFPNDAKRMEFLFELSEKYTAGLFEGGKKTKKAAKKTAGKKKGA
jgi:hypothetical protein